MTDTYFKARPASEQLEILRRGVLELVSEEDLSRKLDLQRPLRIKLGVDPTTPDVHLGQTVVMRKLRQFQELGHQVVLIVGDYTATVGDPSGRSKARPILTHEEVLENARTYQEQFFQIVHPDKTEIVRNGDWFSKLSFGDVTRLMSQITVAQMLEREDFQNRYRGGQPISLHEFLYPMMQAYDSVVIRADVELGGMDQKFNVLRGREMQKSAGQEPQVGLFMPILLGTDGREKMSKSLGNYIGVGENPQSMYHKLFSLPDDLVESYFELLTDRTMDTVRERIARTREGTLHPNEVKADLALDIVTQYHGEEAARGAKAREEKIHAGQAIPEDTPRVEVAPGEHAVVDLLMLAGLTKSKGEGRRFIQNGGVSFDEKKVDDVAAKVAVGEEHLLKLGKRRFARLIAK